MDVDAGTVSVISSLGIVYPLYETTFVDASSGVGTTTTWSPQTADASQYQSVANWATTFSSARYVKFTFPTPIMPTGATVTA